MKKIYIIALLVIVVVLCLVSMTATKQLNDGIYKGESQSKYTAEPYWGQVTLEVKDDKVNLISFQIVDKDKNEVFGPNYERHFRSTPEYVTQCRLEVKGIKAYTEAFLKAKDISKVDAITGATWSYNLFRDALNAALEQALHK